MSEIVIKTVVGDAAYKTEQEFNSVEDAYKDVRPLTDVKATVNQINELQEAGADIVRVSCPDEESTKKLKEITKEISVPIVVRLAGTNFQEGKKILNNSGLKIISANNLADASKKIVEAVK